MAVLGTSARAEEMRDAGRIRGWEWPTEEFVGAERDKGHFMAHCIGGGLDVNVFSQERLRKSGLVIPRRDLPPDGDLLL